MRRIDRNISVYTEPMDLATYIDVKICILTGDFYIPMTKQQIEHMKSLTSEVAVDNYARKLLKDRLQ